MIKRVGCIAIAVKDSKATAAKYMDLLGMEKALDYSLPDVGIKHSELLRLGELFIELIEPTDSDTPLKRFVEKQGEGFFQLALLTDDVDAELKRLGEKGARVSRMVISQEKNIISGYISPKSTSGVVMELTTEHHWPYSILLKK